MNSNLSYSTTIVNGDLKNIKASLFNIATTIRWTELYIDLVALNDDHLIYSTYLKEPNKPSFEAYELNEKESKALNFNVCDFTTSNTDKEIKPWNKARLKYKRGAIKVSIMFKNDKDLDWMMNEQNRLMANQLISVQTEAKILSWQGLPSDHPRPWLENERNKIVNIFRNKGHNYLSSDT